jgi:hypothetical protein
MFNKLGQGLRWLGEKATAGASFIGNKVGGALMSLSPAISVFNPALGAGAASAGAVLKGVGALGDMGSSFLRGGGVNTGALRQTVNNMRSDAAGVKAAYSSFRGPGNPLERRR